MILRACCDCPLEHCHGKISGGCELEFRHLLPMKYPEKERLTGLKIWWVCEFCCNEMIRRGVGEAIS